MKHEKRRKNFSGEDIKIEDFAEELKLSLRFVCFVYKRKREEAENPESETYLLL